MTIRKMDLNLLRVFDSVMRHRSVSAAARELCVSASAVSHALSRLRRMLDDELFLPTETGMEPTPRALSMAATVQGGLEKLAAALYQNVFDPATADRIFTIAATDYTCTVILAPVVGRIAASAPGIGFRIFPLGRTDAVQLLDEAYIDFALNWFGDLPDRMRRIRLLTEHEAILVRSGHPLAQTRVTKPGLLSFKHVVVELTGSEDRGVDGFMIDRGVWRRNWIERLLIDASDPASGAVGQVGVTVPTYAAVLPLLLHTDMIATMPRRLAENAAASGAFTMLDLPFEPLAVPIEAIWHRRSDGDHGLQWLIAEMRAVCTDARESVQQIA